MAKKVDLKAKAKRQKMMAAGGGVLLLAVLAIQVPRTMKMLNPAPPARAAAPADAAPGTVPNDPSILPTPGSISGGAAPAASAGGTFVDSDPAPVAASGQLISFGRFSSKDPFVEQVDATTAGGGSAPAPSASGGTPPGGVVPAGPTAGSPGVAAASGSAVIAVNGVQETVAAGGEFPASAPVFKLVKIVGGEARIAIAGGALASGSPTLTLRRGKAVTLVNTADGTRYELKLVSVG